MLCTIFKYQNVIFGKVQPNKCCAHKLNQPGTLGFYAHFSIMHFYAANGSRSVPYVMLQQHCCIYLIKRMCEMCSMCCANQAQCRMVSRKDDTRIEGMANSKKKREKKKTKQNNREICWPINRQSRTEALDLMAFMPLIVQTNSKYCVVFNETNIKKRHFTFPLYGLFLVHSQAHPIARLRDMAFTHFKYHLTLMHDHVETKT